MHFHSKKDETWMVRSGAFQVRWIDTETAKISTMSLIPGAVWRNPPLMPHQLICIEAGTVSEVSTYDDPKDNHRVMPGDGQLGSSSLAMRAMTSIATARSSGSTPSHRPRC